MVKTLKDIPRDVLLEIISYLTYLPTYAHLNKDIDRRSMYNYTLLIRRVDVEYTRQRTGILETAGFNLNKAAIHGDWEAFQAMAQRWKHKEDISEFTIVCARINGRPDSSSKIHKNSAQYNSLSYIDIYFKSFAWSDQFILNYLAAYKIDARFGWIAPNVQRVVTTMYQQYGDPLWDMLNISDIDRYALVLILEGNWMYPIMQAYAKYPYLTRQELLNRMEDNMATSVIFIGNLLLNMGNILMYRRYYDSSVDKINKDVQDCLAYLDKFDYTI